MKDDNMYLCIIAILVLGLLAVVGIGLNASKSSDKYRTAYEQSLDREKDANEVIRVKDGQIDVLIKAGCGEKK